MAVLRRQARERPVQRARHVPEPLRRHGFAGDPPVWLLYVLAGLAWLWRHAPAAGKAAGILLVALIVAAHLYLFAFALGTPPLG